jgi:uncharacterized protein YaiI (UPF0178 family)
MNVIGSRPDGWWRDRRGAQRRLAAELARFAELSGDAVTVVFDGVEHALEADTIEVAFASGGRDAADHEIARRAGPGITVVTSDRELARRVELAGGQTEGAGRFRARLAG